jgi:hypothetical protein
MIGSFALMLFSSPVASFTSSQVIRTIGGKAVAISTAQLSLNGNTYVSILVHSIHRAKTHSQFTVIRLSIPDAGFEKWRSDLLKIQRFAIRHGSRQHSPLKKFIPLVQDDPSNSTKSPQLVPAWQILPGNEILHIPFNESVPSFNSADWPEAPIV